MTEGFPGSLVVKIPLDNARVVALSPGSGRYLGEGNGNPLQYSCLESSMNRGAWWATVPGIAKSRMPLSDLTVFSPGKPESVVIGKCLPVPTDAAGLQTTFPNGSGLADPTFSSLLWGPVATFLLPSLGLSS